MFDSLAHTIPYQTVQIQDVSVTIKRLDLVHPQISGNKFYKLKYNFLEAQRLSLKKVLTFGGAYSNHIATTAFAAHLCGFESIAIIRGEELAQRPLNSTLMTAQQLGMQLEFINREDYRQKNSVAFLEQLQIRYPEHYVIPEGGTNALAIQGCKEILTPTDLTRFDLICCAVGTGGTLTGLIEASTEHQQVLGFSALKGDFLTQDIQQWTTKHNWRLTDEFCQGGYAKTTAELMQFIQQFEAQHQIALEQVYTGKMLLGIEKMLQRGDIAKDQRILIIHTGGLQGKSPS